MLLTHSRQRSATYVEMLLPHNRQRSTTYVEMLLPHSRQRSVDLSPRGRCARRTHPHTPHAFENTSQHQNYPSQPAREPSGRIHTQHARTYCPFKRAPCAGQALLLQQALHCRNWHLAAGRWLQPAPSHFDDLLPGMLVTCTHERGNCLATTAQAPGTGRCTHATTGRRTRTGTGVAAGTDTRRQWPGQEVHM